MTTSPFSKRNATTNAEPSVLQNATKRPIWEVVAEIGAQISDEEWEQIPSDASINYKHYLYGVPKQNP